jgi:HlyD family secretion protein
LETAEASVLSAEASLERIKRSREFAEIRAPISGVIIDRNVEKGQTVAASLNTPRLFIIAKDLALMEILANVDESDIGQIKQGQDVRFTVASYPERNFVGNVAEIRLQPTVIQNVVNYTVVVETENPRHILLPGMTATLDFVVDEVENVLSIPASALNLKMSDEMNAIMGKMREELLARREVAGGGEGRQRGQGGGEGGQRRQRAGGGGFAGEGGGPGGGGSRPRSASGIPNH